MTRGRYPETFTVEGAGPFPIDMLRYDACFPAQSTDSATITDSLTERVQTPRTVRLRRGEGYRYRPNADRWRQVGWPVVPDA